MKNKELSRRDYEIMGMVSKAYKTGKLSCEEFTNAVVELIISDMTSTPDEMSNDQLHATVLLKLFESIRNNPHSWKKFMIK